MRAEVGGMAEGVRVVVIRVEAGASFSLPCYACRGRTALALGSSTHLYISIPRSSFSSVRCNVCAAPSHTCPMSQSGAGLDRSTS